MRGKIISLITVLTAFLLGGGTMYYFVEANGEKDAGTWENGPSCNRDSRNGQLGARGASAAENRQGSGF